MNNHLGHAVVIVMHLNSDIYSDLIKPKSVVSEHSIDISIWQ